MALNIETGTMRPNSTLVGMARTSGLKNTDVKVVSASSFSVGLRSVDDVFLLGVSGGDSLSSKICTAHGWLQRYLQEMLWTYDGRKRCKEYIRSIILGNGTLDAIILLPIVLVQMGLKKKLVHAVNNDERTSIENSLEQVETDISNGSEFYCIDGQNRIFQAIVPFLQDKFALGPDSLVVEVEGEEFSLANKKFSQFPKEFQNYFKALKLIVVKANSGNIDSFTDSLIWKNEGIPWTPWMKMLTKEFHTKYRRQLGEITQSKGPILASLNKLGGKTYHHDENGHELLVSELLIWMKDQIWAKNLNSHKVQFSEASENQDHLVEKLKKYLTEFGKATAKKKTLTHMEVKNFVILRFALDNPHLFPKLTIPKVKIKLKSKFVGKFRHWNNIMKKDDDKFPESPRWPDAYVPSLDKLGAQIGRSKAPGSYLYANSENGPDFISLRISLLCDRLRDDLEGVLKEGTVIRYDDTPMPTIDQLVDYHDGLDIDGDEVGLLELENYDKGHERSKDNEGTNTLDNLAPENKSANRSWQGTDH